MRRHLLRTVTVGLRELGRRGTRLWSWRRPFGADARVPGRTPPPYPQPGADRGFPPPLLEEGDPELAQALQDYASAQRRESDAQVAFYKATGGLLEGYLSLGYGRLPEDARNALAVKEAPEQFQRHLTAQADARVAHQRLVTLNAVRNNAS